MSLLYSNDVVLARFLAFALPFFFSVSAVDENNFPYRDESGFRLNAPILLVNESATSSFDDKLRVALTPRNHVSAIYKCLKPDN